MRFLRQPGDLVTNRVTNRISADKGYYYPNRMGRIVLTAMDDIMGRHGVNATLNFAGLGRRVDNYPPNNLELGFTFTELATIQRTLDELFGDRGGRALSLRIGRETFKYALKEFMPILGIADLAFRPVTLRGAVPGPTTPVTSSDDGA